MDNTIQNNQNQDHKTQKTASILKKAYWGLWGVYGLISVIIIFGSIFIEVVARKDGVGALLALTMTFLLGAILNIYSFYRFLLSNLRLRSLGLVFPYSIVFLILHTFIILKLIDWLSNNDGGAVIYVVLFVLAAILLGLIINIIAMNIVYRKRIIP